jgi:hypothetical protein
LRESLLAGGSDLWEEGLARISVGDLGHGLLRGELGHYSNLTTAVECGVTISGFFIAVDGTGGLLGSGYWETWYIWPRSINGVGRGRILQG